MREQNNKLSEDLKLSRTQLVGAKAKLEEAKKATSENPGK
jgi:hypothetical protein